MHSEQECLGRDYASRQNEATRCLYLEHSCYQWKPGQSCLVDIHHLITTDISDIIFPKWWKTFCKVPEKIKSIFLLSYRVVAFPESPVCSKMCKRFCLYMLHGVML